MRVFLKESSTGFFLLPVKMRTHGQTITSSRTKHWLRLFLFMAYAQAVRASQSVLRTRDRNLVFVWVGDAKGAVVASPDCPASPPGQCRRRVSGWDMLRGRGFADGYCVYVCVCDV